MTTTAVLLAMCITWMVAASRYGTKAAQHREEEQEEEIDTDRIVAFTTEPLEVDDEGITMRGTIRFANGPEYTYQWTSEDDHVLTTLEEWLTPSVDSLKESLEKEPPGMDYIDQEGNMHFVTLKEEDQIHLRIEEVVRAKAYAHYYGYRPARPSHVRQCRFSNKH